MIDVILALLRSGRYVSLVTAAGYPGLDSGARFGERLRGLVDAFQLCVDMGADTSTFLRFFVMVGCGRSGAGRGEQ